MIYNFLVYRPSKRSMMPLYSSEYTERKNKLTSEKRTLDAGGGIERF